MPTRDVVRLRHLAPSAYLGLDLRSHWAKRFAEIVKRPYIIVGFTA